MLCNVNTMTITGIEASKVTVECYLSNGLPNFDIVGLPDTAVKEARERVRAAAKSSGLPFPNGRITVNLAPASLKKGGTHLDLPILISILASSGCMRRPPENSAFVGELGLDGSIRPVKGVLSMALAAERDGMRTLYVPAENGAEATLAHGPDIVAVRTVQEVVGDVNGDLDLPVEPTWSPKHPEEPLPDFKDVLGQKYAKRAMEVAAAGNHNLMLIGPPGTGKSMLSKRMPSILPDMTWGEILQVSQIYSVVGELSPEEPLVLHRPFRSPHHTISNAGLAGGGSPPRPGEMSLAHKGVLFLDELPEFKRYTMNLLRQPLEDGHVTISRAAGAVTYPADFMLLCAMNPCKCGWFGDPAGRCTCSERAVAEYRGRVSGPLMDRIDMIIQLHPVEFDMLRDRKEEEPSSAIKARVEQARKRQSSRFQGRVGMTNGRMGPDDLRKYCQLDSESSDMMRQAYDILGLTARSYDRIVKVARTIADLAGCEEILSDHIAEAIQYRLPELIKI